MRLTLLLLQAAAAGALAAPPTVSAAEPASFAPTNSVVSRSPHVLSTGMRSSNLEHSIRFYTRGLGMTVLSTRVSGPVTEVIFGYSGSPDRPGIMVFQRKGERQSLPVDHGNSDTKIVLDVPDIAAVIAQLRAAGYSVGDVQQHGPYKIVWVQDPDAYQFEIVERPDVGGVARP